jgi:predicted nucleic acid-binding protein
VLLDVNVILDILLDRKPHVEASARLWAAIERGQSQGFLAAHGVTTIHYLVRRDRGAAVARRAVEAILRVLEVAPVDGEVIRRALELAWTDFEDAVTAASAEATRCDALITRDPRGFPNSPVPVLPPETAAARLAGL